MHYTLCDLCADLTQNATEADACEITVEFTETDTSLTVYIRDNGKGMSPETLKKVTDPFYTDGIKHPKRKIGLGIPFLIQTAAAAGGKWDISSETGKGTTVFMQFDLTNIDTPPIGDTSGLFRQICTFPGDYEMIIRRKKTGASGSLDYTVRRSEILDALGSLDDAESLSLFGQYLQGLEEPEN